MLLEPRCVGCPFVSPEITVLSAGREDEVIERNALFGQEDLARGVIHTDNLPQTNGHVSLVPQDTADGQCDVGWRQGRGRHLVEKRLEQVMVAPVDERNPACRPAERAGGRDPAETTSHDYNMRNGITRPVPPPRMGATPAGSQAVERQPPRPPRRKQQQQQCDFEPVGCGAGEEDRGRQRAQKQRHGPRRHAEQERPAQQEHPPGCGDQLAGEGHGPHCEAGPTGDREREIEARPERQREIAESIAARIEPAGCPHRPDRHPCEPSP